MATKQDDACGGDLTVYDLAERVTAGQVVSCAGQREIAQELLRVRGEVAEVYKLLMLNRATSAAFKVGQLASSMSIEGK